MSASLGQVTSLLPSPTSSNSNGPISDRADDKQARIEAALEGGDVAALRQIAGQPGGFETSELRARVW
jgi:hypothetical protein